MPGNATLAVQGEAILDAVVDGFADAGVSLPTRRFVADGQVVHDCEQVAVALERLFPGLPGAEDGTELRCVVLRSAVWQVHIVRCVPKPVGTTATMPAADAITEAARSIHTDLWVLNRALLASWRASELARTCDSMRIDEGRPIVHSGGFGGSVTRLTLQVQG